VLRAIADFYNGRVNAFKIGALFAATAQLGFAAKAIFIKLAYAAHPGLDAVTLLALRMIFSLPFFLAMAWWARRAAASADVKPVPLTRRDWGYVLLLGFCGYYLASFLDFWGLQYISAGLERLILFTNPTIVVLLSALFFARPIMRRVAFALLLSYAGLALAYWHDLRITDNVSELVFGSFLVFASAMSYAVYLLLGADITKRIGSMRFTAYMMLVATGFVLVQFVLMRPLSALNLPMTVYGYCVGLAVFATAAPVWMMAEGLKRIGANDASMIGSIGPVVTIFLGALFLSEPVSLLQLTGAALVLGGVALISLRSKKTI
jgi:drug/metabolite transporter (DMT)-like permease